MLSPLSSDRTKKSTEAASAASRAEAKKADLKTGTGSEIVEGSKVSLQWVLRRSNGYYVDGSVKMLSAQSGAVKVGDNFDERDNFIFTVGGGTAMPGIDQGVRGMRQGGTRRLVLPMKAAYTLPLDKSAGPLPSDFGPRRQIERELGPAPSLAFLDSRTVQELKMGDIQRLLNEYRWLSRALKPHVPPHTSTGKAEGTEAAELAIATPLRAVPNDV